MKLIIGLGNVGPHYVGTRHNVGFSVLDAFAAAHHLEWLTKDKYKAVTAEGFIAGEKVMLAKPTTFYNLSGEAARAIKDFYKLENTDILVAHDELDLAFGIVRTRFGGSDAGNNGVKSITQHIGEDVARLRIGIANEHLAASDAADFVLSRFTREEAGALGRVLHEAAQLTTRFIDPEQKFEHTSVRISE
ncbi:MAG TPA: aminoacyl-tRNA hydrolase [Candidatus Saccharimonadales bacterium]|nr:aminoacyl-tRNA hydrolase [Candidatus Saccharimonadales bacterium]